MEQESFYIEGNGRGGITKVKKLNCLTWNGDF